MVLNGVTKKNSSSWKNRWVLRINLQLVMVNGCESDPVWSNVFSFFKKMLSEFKTHIHKQKMIVRMSKMWPLQNVYYFYLNTIEDDIHRYLFSYYYDDINFEPNEIVVLFVVLRDSGVYRSP